MYCICSNKSLDEIVLAQKTKALPFEQAIDKYTSCNAGCGSCINEIYVRFDRALPNDGKPNRIAVDCLPDRSQTGLSRWRAAMPSGW